MQGPESVSTRRQRIAELARKAKDLSFTSLNHHLDEAWLREAYRLTRKDGAPGIDDQTARDYEANLEANLRSLLDRAKSGEYWAPPVRRVYIPKGTHGEMRPLGIPTFEDKVLQRAVAMLLESVYEEDFLDVSYGFRPGRSAHQGLERFRNWMMAEGGRWVVEVDIRKFFDSLDHAHLRAILHQRVRDGVLLRLIGKWLNAGVLEGATWSHPEAGTPQGGVASPLLANIYLHAVLDTWFCQVVQPRLRGRSILVRYADDFVLGFTHEEDARRVLAVLPKRFEKHGLVLHPEKTRLIPFGRPPRQTGKAPPEERGGPGTFDFLGFTHHWGLSLWGNWVIKQKTAKDRVARTLRRLADWCRAHRHQPLPEQRKSLASKLRGHYGYFGVTGNWRALSLVYEQAKRIWFKWLRRRSQKRHATWEWFGRLLKFLPLPPPRIVHSALSRA